MNLEFVQKMVDDAESDARQMLKELGLSESQATELLEWVIENDVEDIHRIMVKIHEMKTK